MSTCAGQLCDDNGQKTLFCAMRELDLTCTVKMREYATYTINRLVLAFQLSSLHGPFICLAGYLTWTSFLSNLMQLLISAVIIALGVVFCLLYLAPSSFVLLQIGPAYELLELFLNTYFQF